jgi:hypothetical protein
LPRERSRTNLRLMNISRNLQLSWRRQERYDNNLCWRSDERTAMFVLVGHLNCRLTDEEIAWEMRCHSTLVKCASTVCR